MDIDAGHKKFHASVPVKLMALKPLRQADESWTTVNYGPKQKIPLEAVDNQQMKWTKNNIYIHIIAAAPYLCAFWTTWTRQNFEILHNARQYRCRALCKTSKWLENLNKTYGRARFREIW